MSMSTRARMIRPSMTMELIALAEQKVAQGDALISMVAGEPDFPTPDNICMAGIKAIANGDTRYGAAAGSIPLRKAISEKFLQDNGVHFAPEQIVVATGTKPLLYAALLSICDAGSEVIVPAPYWVSYPAIVELAGATVVPVVCPDTSDFKLTAQALRTAVTQKTRAVILNTPGNPSGVAYSKEEQAALLDVLREHPEIYLITDEIYEHLIYGGNKHYSPATLAPDLANRIIVVNGFSKGYGMIGWRLGFSAGPKEIVKSMGSFLSHILGAPSTITQAAALAALTQAKPYIETNRAEYQSRRNLAMDLLDDIPGLTCKKPDGAFFLFPNCSGLFGKTTPRGTVIRDDADFAKAAIEEAGIAIVPGSAFGLPGYIRVSYSLAVQSLRSGLGNLATFCASLT